MKKVLLVLGIVISLGIVVVAGAIIYIANFDPNENKDWLARKFNEATGRELTLAGDIGLTIYPWLGLTLNDASISNAAGFSATPMLQVQHAEVRVKLLPLLKSEYEIDTVRLQGARINLEVAGNGSNNWDDLSADDSSTITTNDSSESGAAVKNIILGGVAISDTSLVYDNQFNNTHYEISNLAMTIGELVYGQPLAVAMNMDLMSRNPQLASEVSVNGTVTYDVDNSRYDLNPLTLYATLSGPGVPSGSTSIALTTALNMNLEEDTLTLEGLELDALDTHVIANANASRVQTNKPAVTARLSIAGENMGAFFRILEQNELAERIETLNNTFNITASVDADMETGVVMIPDLKLALLGADITGDLQASAINSDKPSASGNLSATGPDLPTLVEVIGALQGGSNSRLSQMGRELARVPDKNFAIKTRFDIDMDSGEMSIPEFAVALFGATVNGTLAGTRINTETPALQGQLTAKGPDLPLLMQIAGQLEGGTETSLNQYGLRLGGVGNRAFTLTTDFNADLQEGNIQLHALDAATLGFNLNGTLDAKNMQASNGSISGSLEMTGKNLREVLTALDQVGLAEVAQSMSLNLAVSGSSANVNISPLRLNLVVAGAQIPNSPQTISLNAATVLNLDNDRISVDNFTLGGLGLDMSGKIDVSNFSDNISYKGEFAVPAFNVRNMLKQLNQEVPSTSDSTVLQKFELGAAFNGTGNDIAIEELTLTLDDTTITGNLAVADFTTRATRFMLDVNSIDADRYLAPASTTRASAETSESSPLEVDALKALDVQGTINIGALTISGLKMSDIIVDMKAIGGEVALNPISANLYDGTFKSDMLLNVNGAEPTAAVNTTLSSINLGPLLQDFMDATYLTGNGNIQLGLTGEGADIRSIKRNLNGNGRVTLENGVLTGVDVGAVLNSIETMIRSKRVAALPKDGATAFDNFSSTLDIRNGVVNSNDLLIEAPGWKVNGAGTLVDLRDDTINYNLIATVEPATATSNFDQFDIGGYSLPIACKGSINDPSCLPDAQQIITAAVTNEVQRRLGDLLQDRLGGAVPQRAPDPPDATEVPETATEPAEETSSVEEELIKRALDRLLR